MYYTYVYIIYIHCIYITSIQTANGEKCTYMYMHDGHLRGIYMYIYTCIQVYYYNTTIHVYKREYLLDYPLVKKRVYGQVSGKWCTQRAGHLIMHDLFCVLC